MLTSHTSQSCRYVVRSLLLASSFLLITACGGVQDNPQNSAVDVGLVTPSTKPSSQPLGLPLPAVYLERCAGCHGRQGQGGIGPQLQGYAKSLAEMTALTRQGLGSMPAFPASAISDADIKILYERFTKPPVAADTYSIADIELLSPEKTLRKATSVLFGRAPTEAAIQQVVEQGEAGLNSVLDELMTSTDFAARIGDFYADEFKLSSIPAILFYSRGFAIQPWWETSANPDDSYQKTEQALQAAGTQLVLHIVRNNLPISELLTANYMMVNGYSARALGVYDLLGYTQATESVWLPYVEPRNATGTYNSVGILTDVTWLNSSLYTDTNLHRMRSRSVYKQFLDYDVMSISDRSPSNQDIANPTLNNPDCTVCHKIVDPVAALFLERNTNGSALYAPNEPLTRPTLWPAGFEGKVFVDDGRNPVRWLAEQLVNDPRFLVAQAHIIYRGLIGKDILRPGTELSAKALAAQSEFFNQIAVELKNNDQNIKAAVKAILKSPYFRAAAIANPEQNSAHANTGTVRLLMPALMQAKTKLLLGVGWTDNQNPDLGADQWAKYTSVYGNLSTDDLGAYAHATAANISVQQSFAADMACRVVPREFFNPDKTTRLLFKQVDATTQPLNADGSVNLADQQNILANLQALYQHLFGESLLTTDAPIQQAYDLWFSTWQAGKQKLQAGQASADLPCPVLAQPVTAVQLPVEQQLLTDPNYTLRSWSVVLAYLLSDYRFFYE